MKNIQKLKPVIILLLMFAYIFVSCQTSIEQRTRRQISATRFAQGFFTSQRNANFMNNLIRAQYNGIRFRDGTTREKIIANGVPCEWVIPPEIESEGVLLYIHGGGFVIGLTGMHLRMTANLAAKMKIKVLLIDYRLAPKYPFPAALDDCVDVYNWLLEQNIPPDKIVIAGDSAGGHLTITTMLKLRELEIPFPAAAAALSPAVNLGPEANIREGYSDPLLHPKASEFYRASFVGDQDYTNPYISPFYADLRGLPPLLVHIGDDEILYDSAVELFNSAEAAGANVTLNVYQGMFHVWQLYSKLPQTEQSLNEIAEFLLSHLQ